MGDVHARALALFQPRLTRIHLVSCRTSYPSETTTTKSNSVRCVVTLLDHHPILHFLDKLAPMEKNTTLSRIPRLVWGQVLTLIPTHELLDALSSSGEEPFADSSLCTRNVAGAVDPNVISDRGSLLSPQIDPHRLCTPRHLPPPKGALGPNSQPWADSQASPDKENVQPLSPSNRCPISVQGPFSTSSTPVSAVHSNQLDTTILPGLPPIQTCLSMTLRGQPINFDLQTLDDDPRSIIEMLCATSSDRDKWMIVGAFYRRRGNIHAALTVVTTMVQGE